MPRNIDERLSQLRTRRRGTDRLERLSESAATEVVQKSTGLESWQQRQTTKSFTQYALGSMQEVGPDYTQKSLDTATRVGKQLEANLPSHGVSATFQLQGSVPLNVHIRGVSDVDMLTLAATFHTYDTSGSWARAGVYRNPSNRTSVEVITDIRNAAEKVLKAAYPAAKVDCSGAKCIAVSGGSLARPIDVVPSHWHDTIVYQSSGVQHDRGVTILDKNAGRTLENLPFLHIHHVHTVDTAVRGGLKKAIRLTKNVKSDADHPDAAKLPSFDIAGLLYHADRAALNRSATYELAALAEAQRFLDWCYRNQTQSTMLMTPDGSRRILDTPAKIAGLLAISNELDDLAANVAIEQASQLKFSARDYIQYRDALNNAYIPSVN